LDEVYVYGSFVQSKMFRNDVRCSDCHDVHSLQLRAQDNGLCTRCHQAEAYDTSEHHFHKKIHEGKPSDGARCIKCHMPERTYMVIDERADHSLRVPRPDLTLSLGVPNACNQNGCHADKSAEWAAKETETWYGKARKPHYGTLLAAGRRQDPTARPALLRLAADPLNATIVRATALSLLGGSPDTLGTSAWRTALMDDEPLVRYTAVQNVDVGDPADLATLLGPLLFDPVRAVRLQAASRLAGPPSTHLETYQREALEKNIVAFKQAMEYSLDFAFAGLNLGNLYERLGDTARAENAYRRAIAVDDLFYPAKMNLAVLLDRQGRTAEAVTLLRQVLEAYPQNFGAAYSLALGLAGLQRYAEAETYMRLAASGMPANPRVHYNLGLLLQQLGQDDAACDALERALELQPESFDTLVALAGLYVKLRRYQDADRLADRLIAGYPQQNAGQELKRWIRSQSTTP
jgi:predicted CXXCH cytochrome family protein